MADARRRHQLEHRVQHAQARPQHRHDDDVGGDLAAGRGLERRLDDDLARRHVAQGLGRQQDADPARGPPELLGRRRASRSLTSASWTSGWVDEVDGHGGTIH